jgi:hypothetical protein
MEIKENQNKCLELMYYEINLISTCVAAVRKQMIYSRYNSCTLTNVYKGKLNFHNDNIHLKLDYGFSFGIYAYASDTIIYNKGTYL